MHRIIFALIILTKCSISVFGQQISDSNVLIYDSIVYEIDTIRSIDTIQHYIYEAPTDYNVIGIKYNIVKPWFEAPKHKSSSITTSPELFLQFSRGKSLFSIGVSYFSCQENVEYFEKKSILHDTSLIKIDTLTFYTLIQTESPPLNIYLTKPNTYPTKDTLTLILKKNRGSSIQIFSIPLKYGYYLNYGYLRVNAGIGFVPTFIISNKSSMNEYLLNDNHRFSLLIKPSIEVSYWLLSHLFVHFSIEYQRSLIAFKTHNNHNIQINNTICGLGFSYLFFDKKRE